MKNYLLMFSLGVLAVTSFTACSDDNTEPSARTNWPKDSLSVFSSAEWLPGGEKGTTSNEQGCYSNPVPQRLVNCSLSTMQIPLQSPSGGWDLLTFVLVANTVTPLMDMGKGRISTAPILWATDIYL